MLTVKFRQFSAHTHTQTSDNQILPNGTGYITDIGMTGPYYSVLGVAPSCAIEKLKTGLPTRFVNEDGVCVLEGCLFDIDEKAEKPLILNLSGGNYGEKIFALIMATVLICCAFTGCSPQSSENKASDTVLATKKLPIILTLN